MCKAARSLVKYCTPIDEQGEGRDGEGRGGVEGRGGGEGWRGGGVEGRGGGEGWRGGG